MATQAMQSGELLSRRQRMGRVELVDVSESANLVFGQVKVVLSRLPVWFLGTPELVLSVLLVEAKQDLADVVGKRRDGLDDDFLVTDFDTRRAVEPMHRLRRHASCQDPVLAHLQREADVARPVGGADAGVEDVALSDPPQCNLAL